MVFLFPSHGGVARRAGVVNQTTQSLQTNNTILTTINNIPIVRNFVENLPHNPALKKLAKEKRQAGILSEVLFWQQVHKGLFHKIDFDRQRIIGNYIVDFYVKRLGLIIEIDGTSHDHKADYDAERQAYLESFGLKMYRISDRDVKMHLQTVMMGLEDYIIGEFGGTNNHPGLRPPLRGRGISVSAATPPREGN